MFSLKRFLKFILLSSLFMSLPLFAKKQFVPIIMDDMIVMVAIDNTSVPLKKTGQIISIYPRDDGDYKIGLTPSYTRNDITEVVEDDLTGLEWQDNLEAKTIIKNWEDAQNYCNALELDGAGWRLPTMKELQSITIYSADNHSIDTKIFENYDTTGHHSYWSSTTVAYDSSYAWVANITYSFTRNRWKSYGGFVRCVR